MGQNSAKELANIEIYPEIHRFWFTEKWKHFKKDFFPQNFLQLQKTRNLDEEITTKVTIGQ